MSSVHLGWLAASMGCTTNVTTTTSAERKLKQAATLPAVISFPIFVIFASVVSMFIGIFAASSASEAALVDAHAAARRLYLSSRLRYLSQELVMANDTFTNGSHVAIDLGGVRAATHATADELLAVHDAIVHGSAGTDHGGSLLRSADQYALLFTDKCMRLNSSSCLPYGHEFHAITHGGLHNLITYTLEQAHLLANDTADALNRDNRRFLFIDQIQPQDVHSGCNRSLALFLDESESHLKVALNLIVALFCVTVITLLTSFALFFKPYVRQIHAESDRASKMLSFLPLHVEMPGARRPSSAARGKADSGGDEDEAVVSRSISTRGIRQ